MNTSKTLVPPIFVTVFSDTKSVALYRTLFTMCLVGKELIIVKNVTLHCTSLSFLKAGLMIYSIVTKLMMKTVHLRLLSETVCLDLYVLGTDNLTVKQRNKHTVEAFKYKVIFTIMFPHL